MMTGDSVKPEQETGFILVHHSPGFHRRRCIWRATEMLGISLAAISAFEANPIGNHNLL